MIRSFKHRGLKRLYETGDRSKINPLHIDKIEVSGNWRIVFRFEAGQASDIGLVDYH